MKYSESALLKSMPNTRICKIWLFARRFVGPSSFSNRTSNWKRYNIYSGFV
jgi:hypothetical protein